MPGEIEDVRSRAPAGWGEPNIRTSEFPDQRILAENRGPPVPPLPVPVVVAGNEQTLGAPLSDGQHLRGDLSLRVVAPGIPQRRHPARVDVVTGRSESDWSASSRSTGSPS